MRLFELTDIDPQTAKLIAITDQLRVGLDKNPDLQWSTDDLLQYFQKYDITLDITDFYDMIKKPPLNNVISNIQGDNVIFKGQDTSTPATSTDNTDSKKIVQQMAKSANDLI
jgi:hypothetical protein